MQRIDTYETEADFIEFRFNDEETALAAEKHFPVNFVRSGEGVIEYRSDSMAIEAIRTKLENAGIAWSEAESGLTEDDMWPEEASDDNFTP